MLSALPQVQPASAIAASDSLGTGPRSNTEGGSNFAALMQRQSERGRSDLRLFALNATEQRLAEQRPSQAHQAEPGAGAAHRGGDADSSGGRSTSPDDRAGLNVGTGSTPSAASARPRDNSTESRNAASLSLNGKLQRARSAAPDATRQAAAGAASTRAGARLVPAAAAAEDSGIPSADPIRADDPLLDSTAATAATTPLPSAAAPAAAVMGQRGERLSALGRTSLSRLPVNSGAAEIAGPTSSRRSTAGWVADQQRLRGAGTGRPIAPEDATLAKPVAGVPGAPTGQDATSATASAADLRAPALVGYATSPSTGPFTLPGAVPDDGPSGAPTDTAAALNAATANAGGRGRSAALPGTPDGSAPQNQANPRRTGTASGLAPDLPGPADQANAGPAVRQAGTALPATRPSSPPAVPTAGAAQTPGAGIATHALAPLAVDGASAIASASQSALLIVTDHNTGSSSDSTATAGSVTALPDTVPANAVAGPRGGQAPGPIGELAAVKPGAKSSTLDPAGAGQMSGLRSGATAVADGLIGQSIAQAGDGVEPSGHDNAAPRTRSSPMRASPGAETAVPTSPLPVTDPTLASNPTSAPTEGGATANASTNAPTNASTSAAPRAGPVAGADPRRALATAAGPDGAAVSHRLAGGERVSALARDSADTGTTDPAALPAPRRAGEPAKIAGPLASAEPVSLQPNLTAAYGAGPDKGLSLHPDESAAASDGGPAGLAATSSAATAAAALNRSDATGPHAAPVEARIAVPLDSPTFAPALGAQISLFARDGVQTARLQLNPAEMGPIAVQIAVDGNAARIDFQADRAATREVIEASLPALAGALQDAGLTLTGGGVFQQHPGRQAPPEPGPATAAARLPASATGLDAVAGGLAASSRQRTPRGLVDLVA